jgi:hypothetical protein
MTLHRASLFIVLQAAAGERRQAALGGGAGPRCPRPMVSSSGLPQEPLDRSSAALTRRSTAEGGQGSGGKSGRGQTLLCASVAGCNTTPRLIRDRKGAWKCGRAHVVDRATAAQHAQHKRTSRRTTRRTPLAHFPSCPPLRPSPMAAPQQRPRLIDELLTPDFLAQNLLPWLSTRDYFRASGVCRCCAAA